MSAMRPPLTFVQDLQEDPDTGELKQSCGSPDSIPRDLFRLLFKAPAPAVFPVVLTESLCPETTGPGDKTKNRWQKMNLLSSAPG